MAKIAIDAGHGKNTSGKRCLESLDPKETREWVLNDRIADYLADFLLIAGHKTLRVDDTDGSTDVSLENRVKKANEWGADFYISVHHNAGVKGGSGGGIEVYVCKGCQAKSTQAQNAIYKHVIDRTGLKGNRSDGTKAASFYVVAKTRMPACLIECGFMDSKTDIEYILDAEWAKKCALGIAEGICEVFGGTVKETASKPKKSGSGSKSATKQATSDKTSNKTSGLKVKVLCDLNIRSGAGTKHKVVGTIKDKGTYTIVATKHVSGVPWGKLKSGVGWISIHSKYVKRV